MSATPAARDAIDWGIDPAVSKAYVCTLVITEICNLNCAYCYETHRAGYEMPFEIAAASIMREYEYAKHIGRGDGFFVDFMGGEPLMNFKLIKEIVEWAEKSELPFYFFVTTNGTLLDDRSKAWFREHKDVIAIGLSYDGKAHGQRLNRDAAEREIPLSFIKTLWPQNNIHMVVSRKSLPYFAMDVIRLHGDGFGVETALAQGEDWSDENALMYYEQLRRLADAYIADDTLTPIKLMTQRLRFNNVSDYERHHSCGAGIYSAAYDSNGVRYACHMFSPVVVGERAMPLEHMLNENEYDAANPACDECALNKLCGGCIGVNYKDRGAINAFDSRMCKMTLVQLKAACEFQLRALYQRKDRLSAYDMLRLKEALAAKEILSSLSGDIPYKRII